MAEQHTQDPIAQRRKRVTDRLADVQAYRGTELYKAFVELLGAIDDCYGDDLRSVSTEDLKFKQGGSKQCVLLREALISGGVAIPKV